MPTREEMHNLVQGIIGTHEARTDGIATLRGEVREHRRAAQAQLREVGRNHQAMARRQRADLAHGRADMRAGEAQRQEGVNTWLGEVHQGHQAMSSQLRADLSRGHAALSRADARRKGEVHTWLMKVDRAHQSMARRLQADLGRSHMALTREEAQRKAAVQALMDHVAAERAGGQKEWQRLVHNMAGKRNGAVMTEEFTALGDRVFQYLANHPDGARLTEIEREFGVGRLQAGRVMRHLMDEGKAEKRDYCYFAT